MVELKPISWKIMLEVFTKGNPIVVKEVPIVFRERTAGESHFNFKQCMLYLKHLAIVAYRRHRILRFFSVGLMGACVHFAVLVGLTEGLGLWYLWSTIAAVLGSTTFNYVLNHKWTFAGRVNKNLAKGWVKYEVIDEGMDALFVGEMYLLVSVIGVWYILATILAAGFNFPIRYALCKKFIWCPKKKTNPEDGDYEWKTFYKGWFLQRWWKGAIAKTIWNWIPKSEKLLNIGCGSSPIAVKYPSSVNVDASKEKLEFLQGRLPRIVTVNTQAEELPFVDAQFDHVICIEMIEHSHHPDKVVAEIERMLKPGGRVIISTPDYHKLFWKIAKVFVGREDDHVSHLSRLELEELCRDYRLMPVRHKYVAMCDLVEMFEKPNGTERSSSGYY